MRVGPPPDINIHCLSLPISGSFLICFDTQDSCSSSLCTCSREPCWQPLTTEKSFKMGWDATRGFPDIMWISVMVTCTPQDNTATLLDCSYLLLATSFLIHIVLRQWSLAGVHFTTHIIFSFVTHVKFLLGLQLSAAPKQVSRQVLAQFGSKSV